MLDYQLHLLRAADLTREAATHRLAREAGEARPARQARVTRPHPRTATGRTPSCATA
ncbi:hypothetical protein M1P56_27060 [Streptomyces sp. HU2014]|uniref:hypothetical protein n=1 Tax=Streptomyces sp. HU2014 TaxID=2939414 RepID=UPI00200D99AB|nr:hypothetical protein [Streptomyces sp. HU2014]UQI47736.1 hypothetical protein M1P56_27060 [Streptomyces sp. HU2014]